MTMGTVQPRLGTAPSVAELAAVANPVERAAWISRLARQYGTLPGALADVRRDALDEARTAGHAVATLAIWVGLSPGRISQLIGKKRTRSDATAPNLAEDCAPPAVLPTTFTGRKTAAGGDANMLPAAVTP